MSFGYGHHATKIMHEAKTSQAIRETISIGQEPHLTRPVFACDVNGIIIPCTKTYCGSHARVRLQRYASPITIFPKKTNRKWSAPS